MAPRTLAWTLTAGLLGGCAAAPDRPAPEPPAPRTSSVEAYSLFGTELRRPDLPPETRERFEDNLEAAERAHARAPDDVETNVWLGRRLAYLGRYRDAVDVYTEALERFPDSYRLLRHRGHRRITLRQFALAERDLERAAELAEPHEDAYEPDGLPNEQGVPRSTDKSNIYYHLGLARYLQGDFEGAVGAYTEGMAFARVNDDMTVAFADWFYRALRRAGRDGEAADVLALAHPDMTIIENDAYHRLLLMYRGEVSPADVLDEHEPGSLGWATVAYGVANWRLVEGRTDEALALLSEIVRSDAWASFGYIAAEADLARRSEGG